MDAIAAAAYTLATVTLFAKLVFTVSLQGRRRIQAARFQYPEDAAHWRGEAVSEEEEIVVRAQRLLRNDGESQPYFLALGAAYVALGAWPPAAPIYFGVYVASRLAHAAFFLKPRQPHRTRAYSVGLLVLLALAVHVSIEALSQISG